MKRILCGLMTMICLAVFVSCGSSSDTELSADIGKSGSPDGKWEIIGMIQPDGSKLPASAMKDWYECFDIDDGVGKYTVRAEGMDKIYYVTVEKMSDNSYDVKMKGKVSIGTARFGKDRMAYDVVTDEGTSIFIYEKK